MARIGLYQRGIKATLTLEFGHRLGSVRGNGI